jgi:hypothetical protein
MSNPGGTYINVVKNVLNEAEHADLLNALVLRVGIV